MSARPGPAGDPIFYFFRDTMLTGGDATRIYLIRHAQSQGNTGEDMATGDPDLTDVGREQAERLGRRMKDQRLDVIYASPLRRTQQTALSIADPAGLDVLPKHDLVEVTLGQPDQTSAAASRAAGRGSAEDRRGRDMGRIPRKRGRPGDANRE
jgi:broad specificity phosphatase PhoE